MSTQEIKSNATAWMILNDGAEIPGAVHIYADISEIDELLALTYFIWENDWQSRQAARMFLDAWTFQALSKKLKSRTFVKDELAAAVKGYITSKPYRIFPESFADVVADCVELLKRRGEGEYIQPSEVVLNGSDLIDTLNQRFLRARYGGRYNTVPGCRDMYFRVSSVGFDWFPIIRAFVDKHAASVETVTIVRDYESTGCEKYYFDSKGCPHNKMPVADFFAGSGSTKLADGTDRVSKMLSEGYAAAQMRAWLWPGWDYERILNRIRILKYKEECCLFEEVPK